MTRGILYGKDLYRDVVAYAQFGDHRTATEGETRTTDWLAERLAACGLEVGFQPCPADTFFIDQTHLAVDGEAVECFPLWPPTWTGKTPVQGRLVAAEEGKAVPEGSVALFNPSFSYGALPFSQEEADRAAMQAVAEAGAVAALVVSNGPSDGIHAFNTPEGTGRWPIPVALVPKRSRSLLASAAEKGAGVSLLLHGRDEPRADARNVIAKLTRGSDIIVISTPKSGWFTCAGERGPGVALFLTLAEWASRRDSPVSYIFDANTGHETGGTGIARFVEDVAPPPDQVLAWVHLGANIATWAWEETSAGPVKRARPEDYRVVCNSEELLPLLADALTSLPGLEPRAGRGIGEMRLVIETGYRGFGVNGGPYRYFHAPEDTPDVATAPELLEPVAVALTRVLELLEAKGRPET